MNKAVKYTLIGLGVVTALSLFAARKLLAPIVGKITSPFGNRIINGSTEFHNGIDIAAPTGTVIKAPADGTVTSEYYNDLGGNQLIIKHDNGYTTGYAHLASYLVKNGDKVTQGQGIATVGVTGESTGPHLHFTLRDSANNFIDPSLYI